jgi:ABC-type lipoprotein export system ATPase subunit
VAATVPASGSPAFPRGSEWRRWDLQVHTPFSSLNNGFGSDFDAFAKALFEAAVAADVHAIGVTDYFSIEGYAELKALVQDNRRAETLLGAELASAARGILLLPNVELRSTVLVRKPNGSDSRVNFHVLFSEELDVRTLEDDFLRELRFTALAGPWRPDEEWSLSRANLEKLGRELRTTHAPFAGGTDAFIGMMNAAITHESVTKVLERQDSRFGGRYLLALPADEDLSQVSWNGQGHLQRKLLIQKSHLFFSANPSTREFGLGRKHASVAQFVDEFSSLKACIHGSDAHDYAHLFRPDRDRYCWIKGDLTFRGLEQLLYEPETRVFIGEIPPSLERLRSRPTRVVRRVDVHKVAGAPLREDWFDTSLELNHELVAIIGNKGSGKSALADVLGLMGNTPRFGSFSFLNVDRFRNPRDPKAQHFEASIQWADGTVDGPRSLHVDPDLTNIEKIKYIPQNYLEEICNEVGAGRGGRFYAELQQAIFSHVPGSERLGFQTLDDLLESRGVEINRAIELTKSQLRGVNRDIVRLEARASPSFRRGLEQQLREKQRELTAHEQIRPVEVVPPQEDPAVVEQSAATTVALAEQRAATADLVEQIRVLREEDAALARREARASSLIDRVTNLQRQIEGELTAAAADFVDVGVEPATVIRLSIDIQPLRDAATSFQLRRRTIAEALDPEQAEGLMQRARQVSELIAQLESQLSAPQRAYQEYLATMAAWELARLALLGSEDTPGTIRFFEAQLRELAEIPGALRQLRRRRRRLSLEIYREKRRLQSHFERYYRPVQDFLTSHRLASSEQFRLTFSASITQDGFLDDFIPLIDRGRIGPFAGVEEGRNRLETILNSVRWASAREVIRCAETIVSSMTIHDGRELTIASQLRQGTLVEDLYDQLYGLDYLEPMYELKWDGRGVEELSPGERGNLLLIFYLLIDRDDIPFVIDQPEENLDNQTIVGTLVPCMRDAKTRRQVIMVTHNPNLAVVCDADQVIHAAIRKEARNRLTYRSGSIEDPTTNQLIIDILEGTRPAFDQRGARYQPPRLRPTA